MENDEVPPINLKQQKQQLELRLLELEIEKTAAEKANLEKKWYKIPAWYSVILPTLLGLATIVVAWSTGFLNKQALVNKNEAILNRIESYRTKENVDKLLSIRDSLLTVIKKNIKALDSIKSVTDNYKAQYDTLYVKARSGSEREAYLLKENALLHQQVGAKDEIISELNQRPYIDISHPFISNLGLLSSDTNSSIFKASIPSSLDRTDLSGYKFQPVADSNLLRQLQHK